jgi:hypothetical protein
MVTLNNPVTDLKPNNVYHLVMNFADAVVGTGGQDTVEEFNTNDLICGNSDTPGELRQIRVLLMQGNSSATHRAIAPSLQGDAVHAHGGGVDQQHVPGIGLAELGDVLEAFHGADIGNQRGDGADHRESSFPVWWCLWIKAGEASGLAGNDDGDLPLKIEHGAVDEWLVLSHAFAVHEEPFFEKRGAGEYDIGTGDQIGGVGFGNVFRNTDDFDLRFETVQRLCGASRATAAQCIAGHEDLAVEIAGFQVAGMGENQFSHARSSQGKCQRATQSADARHQGRAVFQLLLTGFAKA